MPNYIQPDDESQLPRLQMMENQPSLSQFGESKPVMPRSVLGTDVAPDKQMPKAEKLAADPKAEAKFSANQDFHNQLRQFGDQKAALDHIMPTNIKDPNYMQDLASYSAARNRIKQNEIDFKQANPWGSAGNHPGFFGKLGHVLGTIGNIAGSTLAPEVMMNIPGSKLNLDMQSSQAERGIDEAEGQYANLQKAEAAVDTGHSHLKEADTHATTEPIKANAAADTANSKDRETTLKEDDAKSQFNNAILDAYQRGVNPLEDPKVQQLHQLMQQQKPVNLQDKTGTDGKGNLARALFNPDPNATTPYLHADHTPFPDFKPEPNQTTNPQVSVFVPGATPGSAKLQVLHQGQEFNATNAINPGQLTATNKSVVAEQGAVNSIKGYQQNFQQNRSQLHPADIEALKVLTSHAQAGFANQLFQDAGSGVLDALVGQPFTNYTQKLMQGTMSEDQYKQLSPAGQKMLFGYTHAIVANFVNMKQKLGSIGRNPDQIQAEMANIPVPYIDTNAANEAFTRTLRDAQATTFNPFGGGTDNNQPPPTAPTGGLEGRPSFAEWKKQQGVH